jgi:hypothetical protein
MTMLLIPREVERECIFKETSLKSYILKQTTGKKHYLSRERNLVCIEPTYFFFNFLTIRKILGPFPPQNLDSLGMIDIWDVFFTFCLISRKSQCSHQKAFCPLEFSMVSGLGQHASCI